ncbi:hypothetical protein GCM10011379_55650 [Filimonas zeae]|uniref:TonB-dependent receptor plug domain-containing protein n=2 Tax=Filimonas zeae TaxID=1737353 RepID=A0A917J6Y8_9BACT|nr:hypothetical protein GCM10011379_55650 [Filimonas zeae]
MVSKRICRTVAMAVAVTFGVTVQAQKLDEALGKLGEEYQPERAYLHFDKGAYSPGETIWFKAYLQAGIFPSDISKNFYVDWTDGTGLVLFHTTTPLLEGTAKGSFDIPSTYKGQVIHVRAYTSWMKNFDTVFFYNKDLRVVQAKDAATAVKKTEVNLQFLPEGGDMIAGLKSRVAFKATDQWGKPVFVKGKITNAAGELVDTFKAVHDGMGTVEIETKAGDSYTATYTGADGQPKTVKLPELKTVGATLSVNGYGARRSFLVERTADAPDNFKTLYIMATLQQQLIYRAKVDLTESAAIGGSMPVGNLPSGLVNITLFDANWVPVAERITFVNNHNYSFKPTIEVVGDTRKRAKSFIDIDVPDTVSANMSISVTDLNAGADTSDNIVSHLLLTSDLRGYIHNPAFYFKNESDSLQKYLDLVMLTSGWRRINWQDIANNKMPDIKYRRDSSYLSFSGKVFGATPIQIREAANINLIMKSRDSSTSLNFLPLRPDGSFSDPSMLFFDTLKVYYQFNKIRDMASRVAVSFSNGLLPVPYRIGDLPPVANLVIFDTSGNARIRLLANEQARLTKLLQTTTLEGVTVRSKAKSPMQILDDKYANGLFKGDGYQFDVMNDVVAQSSFSVFQYLQGRVAGLQINNTGTGGQPSATWRGSNTSFFLDEMPVDAQQLSNIPMADVAYIKVMRPPFFGSFGGGSGGAIAVYTRRGGDVKSEPGKGLDSKEIAGYTKFKQFYSPNYAVADSRHEQPDVRSTLYWNPYVLTDPKTHRISLEFYNSDITKKMRVVIEGMNKEGRLVHFEQIVD